MGFRVRVHTIPICRLFGVHKHDFCLTSADTPCMVGALCSFDSVASGATSIRLCDERYGACVLSIIRWSGAQSQIGIDHQFSRRERLLWIN